jgi:redox-sensitive bicupin YhaK (pirin superfamily)
LLSLDLHEGRNTALVLLKGSVQINGVKLRVSGSWCCSSATASVDP